MLRNYLKTALRNLWRNRTYGLLNIGGLAVGVTCAALIMLWVENEVTFDHNQPKRDRLYQVMSNQVYNGATHTFGATPGPLGPAMLTEIPGVVNASRGTWSRPELFSRGEKAIYEVGSYVDAGFFRMFAYDFVQGSAANPFPALHSVVISERMAHKFFGAANPLGQALRMNNGQAYTVSGVYRDPPANSSLTDQWMAQFKALESTNAWLRAWDNNCLATFVELAPLADPARINRQLHGFIQRRTAEANSEPFLFGMNDWRLRSQFTNGVPDGGRIEYVRLFSMVAGFILLIACINFMNLATARSEQRAREVGMRKVLGGTRAMLIGQFVGESVLLAFLAVGLAVLLIWLLLPAFNTLVEQPLALRLTRPLHWLGLVGIGLVTGVLAGSYPAFYLSSFAPVAVLKGRRLSTDAGAGFIRQGLVVFQFTISIVLIVGTIVVYQQVQYVQARQLGYNKARLIYLTLADNSLSHFSAIRNELLATGAVENAAMSSGTTLQLYSNGGGWTWAGSENTKDILIQREPVSAEYRSTIGLKLVAGRDFRPDALSDTTNVLINETLARLIGKDDVIGTLLTQGERRRFTVIGVVQDFVFNDFYKPTQPLMLMISPKELATLTIRLKPAADLSASLNTVSAAVRKANPGYPFEYAFVDQQFARTFQNEALIGRLAGVFAGLAILISCLGLFGLAAYTAERRAREIGIRKVLGASVQAIVQLLSKDFLLLVVVSCLLAFPVAWWASHSWLQSYAYHTPISWWIFGLAGAGALLIALLTVSFQALKAAVANPVRSLRTE